MDESKNDQDNTSPGPEGHDSKTPAAEQPEPAVAHPLIAGLRERFGDINHEGDDQLGTPIVRLSSETLLETMTWLHDDPEMLFDYLSSITAVDWTERRPRFDVVYHLYSIANGHRLSVKVGCDDGDGVPSVCDVWKTADWLERETYDLYGIEFLGHPNLERIFLPEDWEGFPLRKDYPLEGPNLELLTRQHVAFRGGRFDRIRGEFELTEQERQMAGPGIVGPLWSPKEEGEE